MKAPDPVDLREQGFLRAAAVLWQFDAGSLSPDDAEPARPGEAAAALSPYVARVRLRGGDRWTLRDALRPPLLHGADLPTLQRLRARNAALTSPEQMIVDRWLVGGDPELGAYGVDELAVLERIGGWFDPPLPHLPDAHELARLRALARLREPLTALANASFRGRTQELARLHQFVDAAPGQAPALLVVCGIGGTGKSTLTAKLLLELLARAHPLGHTGKPASPHDQGDVVAYLDFDDPTLDIADGVTLMLKILEQAAAQRPDVPGLEPLARRANQATVDLSAGGRGPGRAAAARASTEELAGELGRLLGEAGVARVTLVLDTFEEQAYASIDNQQHLVEVVAILHHHVAGLHTLVVSRAQLDATGAEHMVIGDLDEAAARLFLADRGVADPGLVAEVLRLAHGNPLSLKLAAASIEKWGAEGLKGIEQHDALEQSLVQGQLYERILKHVHETEIRELAHPGLVVRRVTPELVERVLAEPCGLGVIDEARAAELFAQLAREVSLVRVAPDGALEHRPDVRRVMLPLLYRDRPAVARDIHARAAAYYGQRAGDVALAEEVYHRLALGEDGDLGRLTPGAAARLRNALDELPESCWGRLASYVGIDLPPERQQAAATADQERRLEQRLRDLLRSDRAEEALAELEKQKPSGPSSVLWRWQGRALQLVRRNEEALAALERALATLAGPADEARTDLELAIEIAKKIRDPRLARLQRDLAAMTPPVGPPSMAAPSGGVFVTRSGVPVTRGPTTIGGPVQAPPRPKTWLDDQDLRLLVQTAVQAPRLESFSNEPAAAASTRAATMYAKAMKLNRKAAGDDGAQMLAWVGDLNETHGGLETVQRALETRLTRK